jgi:flagellar motor protein MotB
MRLLAVVSATLLVACATDPPPKPAPPPRSPCLDIDPQKVGDIAALDRENTENQGKVATLEKTIAALQQKLDEAGTVGATVEREPAPTPAKPVKVAKTKRAKEREPPPEVPSAPSGGDRVRVRLSDELVFTSGSARITRAGRHALDQIAEVFKQTPSKRIEVRGHTDSLPAGKAWEDNWQLSSERARRVAIYLSEQGVDRKRIIATAYADSEPLDGGDDPDARAKNRRVEIFMEPTE